METLECPHCSDRFNTDVASGLPDAKTVRCNRCKQSFSLGSARKLGRIGNVAQDVAMATAPTAKATIAIPPPLAKELIVCNFCKSPVDRDALKCPHCQEWLRDDSRLRPGPPEVPATKSISGVATVANRRSSKKFLLPGIIAGVVMTVGVFGLIAYKSLWVEPAIKTAVSKSTGMEFVLCPAGTFTMGSPLSEVDHTEDETQHSVTITQPFYLGKYEVTQEEYRRVMRINPSWFLKSERLPVDSVTWFDAIWFCNKLSELDGMPPCYKISDITTSGSCISDAHVERVQSVRGYRLPTEAEWEYACRAGTTTPFSFGSNISKSQVNFDGSRPYNKAPQGLHRKKTLEVDALSGNAWGLHQMHGNVSEWCQDWCGDALDLPKSHSGAMLDACWVRRGGSWSDGASSCRSAFRCGTEPYDMGFFEAGFRVVLVRGPE